MEIVIGGEAAPLSVLPSPDGEHVDGVVIGTHTVRPGTRSTIGGEVVSVGLEGELWVDGKVVPLPRTAEGRREGWGLEEVCLR